MKFYRLSLQASVELDGGRFEDGFHHIRDGCPSDWSRRPVPNPLRERPVAGLLRRRRGPTYSRSMTVLRMDNVLVVVDDLEAVKAFFAELGLELEGEAVVEGHFGRPPHRSPWRPGHHRLDADPDGHGRIELDKFHTPAAVRAEPEDAPVNSLGIRRIMFAVDDIENVLGRLRRHGAELIGEVVQYEDQVQLCYVRGPEGIVVALAEQLS